MVLLPNKCRRRFVVAAATLVTAACASVAGSPSAEPSTRPSAAATTTAPPADANAERFDMPDSTSADDTAAHAPTA
jgi:hypothetical protein